MILKKYWIISLAVLSVSTFANKGKAKVTSKKPPMPKLVQPKWMMSDFMSLADYDPNKLLNYGQTLFKKETLENAKREPAMAYHWQYRLAYVQALERFFLPKSKHSPAQRKKAKDLIAVASFVDPALLVRDGAIETIRRILRMRPKNSGTWRKILEKAFVDKKNIVAGEGLFIRETILTAMKEASISLSKKIVYEAKKDKNKRIRALLYY